MVGQLIEQVKRGKDLTMDEMSQVIGHVMTGALPDDVVASLLLSLRSKGEATAEIAGAALAMRQHMTPIHTSRTGVVDTCGTGGDGSGTFNISTAAAIVSAAAGAVVAKHGNRKISSRTGSADVLAVLGVNIDAGVESVEACLDEVGICFCFAPLMHGAMKHVASVRKSLGVPTIFNLLGPLCNPAGAPYQVMGVGRENLVPQLAEALAMLGTQRAVVVHGSDGLGEISNSAPTTVIEIQGSTLHETTWSPETFGLQPSRREPLMVEDPAQSAQIIRDILAGKSGAARDIVVINAAAALWVSGVQPTLTEGAQVASHAIDSGDAQATLDQLVLVSNR